MPQSPACSASQLRFRACAAACSVTGPRGPGTQSCSTHEPARVAVELGENAVEVDVARTELAEDAGAPRLGPVGAPSRSDVEPHVLDDAVVDPLAPVAQRADGVAAAERQVPRVEQQADVGPLEQPLDLGRRLDARAHVVVERRLEAARARERARPRRVDARRVEAATRPAVAVGARVARAPAARRTPRLEQVERRAPAP